MGIWQLITFPWLGGEIYMMALILEVCDLPSLFLTHIKIQQTAPRGKAKNKRHSLEVFGTARFPAPKDMGVEPKIMGKPTQIIHFNRVWNHYKPSILGYPYFWFNTHIQYDPKFGSRMGFSNPIMGDSRDPFLAVFSQGTPSVDPPPQSYVSPRNMALIAGPIKGNQWLINP